MPQRVFTSDDQMAFAELSGDFNPLHLDSMLARRMLFGRQVVHGLHAMLWGLDEHLKAGAHPLQLQTVQANFQAGLGVGESVRCVTVGQDDRRVAFQLETDETQAAWVEVGLGPLQRRIADALPGTPPEPQKCRKRNSEDVAAASGSIPLYLNGGLSGRLFPNLIRVLPPMQLAALLATTRLVGMECPGFHSIYSSLSLAFSPEDAVSAALNYRVTSCNERLALVSMEVAAPGMKGAVKAFLRPEPQRQPAYADVRRQVETEEFSGQRALIVGGSRGLGETAAKLLAAGGAEIVLTYYRGKHDARRIAEEIVSHGGRAQCLPFNVLEPQRGLASMIGGRPVPLYLYYFATPHIFGAAKGKFSPQRFAQFCEHYVTGFLRTVQSAAGPAAGLQKVFYPSSVAVEELPLDMGEYAAAKMAGEVLCDFLQKAHSGLVVYRPRLPRVATDQTVSLLPVSSQEPVSVLLSSLRHLKQM
jgi:hypothetical protein